MHLLYWNHVYPTAIMIVKGIESKTNDSKLSKSCYNDSESLPTDYQPPICGSKLCKISLFSCCSSPLYKELATLLTFQQVVWVLSIMLSIIPVKSYPMWLCFQDVMVVTHLRKPIYLAFCYVYSCLFFSIFVIHVVRMVMVFLFTKMLVIAYFVQYFLALYICMM